MSQTYLQGAPRGRTGRVEVSDLPAPQALRPVQTAVDTCAAPEKPPTDNNLQRLGEALQGFSRSLAGLGHQQQKSEDPRLAEIYRIQSSSSDQEMIQRMADGSLPHRDVPHLNALWEKDYGERVARVALHDLRLGVQDGTVSLVDPEGRPVDIQSLIAERAAQYSEPFRNSIHFQKAFAGVVETNRNSLTDMVRGKVAEVNRERNTTMVQSAMADLFRLSAEGMDSDQLRTEWNRRTETAYKVAGMRPSDTDALMIGLIRQQIKADPDGAERLLTLDRGKGFEGQQIGSLATNPTYRRETAEIATAINDERVKRYDAAEQNRLAVDARERIDKDPAAFPFILNHAYTNPYAARDPSKNAQRMVSRESVQDAALALFQRDSDMAFRRESISDATAAAETKFEREFAVYVPANRPHPVWATTLQTAGRILSNPQAVSDPANVARLEQASELYNTLAVRNPGYLRETLGIQDREQRLFDQINVYRRHVGDPMNEAARKAAEFVNNPPPALTGAEVADLRKKADALDFNGWFRSGGASTTTPTSWWGEVGPQNIMMLRSQVFDTARAIAADRSVPVERAVSAAVERVRDRTTLFNGQMIPPNVHLTKESAPFYQKRLDELFEENKQLLQSMGISSARSLSLREDVPGTFRVIGSDGQSVAIPTLSADGRPVGYDVLRIDARDIYAIREQSKQDALNKLLRRSQDATDRAIINTPTHTLPRGKYPYKIGHGYERGGRGNYVPTDVTEADREAARERLIQREFEDHGATPPSSTPSAEDHKPALNYRSPRRSR